MKTETLVILGVLAAGGIYLATRPSAPTLPPGYKPGPKPGTVVTPQGYILNEAGQVINEAGQVLQVIDKASVLYQSIFGGGTSNDQGTRYAGDSADTSQEEKDYEQQQFGNA